MLKACLAKLSWAFFGGEELKRTAQGAEGLFQVVPNLIVGAWLPGSKNLVIFCNTFCQCASLFHSQCLSILIYFRLLYLCLS